MSASWTVLRLHTAAGAGEGRDLPLIVRELGHVEGARAHEAPLALRDRTDDNGAISRRYCRQVEIGTPYAARSTNGARGRLRHGARPDSLAGAASRSARAGRSMTCSRPDWRSPKDLTIHALRRVVSGRPRHRVGRSGPGGAALARLPLGKRSSGRSRTSRAAVRVRGVEHPRRSAYRPSFTVKRTGLGADPRPRAQQDEASGEVTRPGVRRVDRARVADERAVGRADARVAAAATVDQPVHHRALALSL